MSEAPHSPEPQDFHTDLSVGEILRRTRVHYGQSLEQIAQVLRIRPSHLEALEKGDISQLPGRVYAIGFVRAYAEYLGLDGDKVVHLFKNQSVGKAARPDLQFPVAADESKVPTFPMIGAGIAISVAVLVVIVLLLGGGEEEAGIPAVPGNMQEQALSEAPSIIPVTDTPPPQPPPMFNEDAASVVTAGDVAAAATAEAVSPVTVPAGTAIQRVIINVEDNSWIEVRDAAGKVLVSQVLKPGDQFLVPNQEGMTLSTGNAGGITIVLDGKALPKIGNPAQVKRNISLNPSDLLKP